MSLADDFSRLDELHQRGALTDDEFARAKARLLQADAAPAAGGAPEAFQALRRSRDDRWIGGVCGGLARITGLPSWTWRLLFVLGMVCAGTGALLYLLLWIFVPADPPARGSLPSGPAHAG